MDVLCLGLMVCDVIVKPVSKDIMEKDLSIVDCVKMSTGGDAFNVANNLSTIGMSSGIIARIGDDQYGNFLIKKAQKLGVDIRGVKFSKECGSAVCITLIQPNGERNFAYYIGAGGLLCEEDVDYNLIRDAKILSVGGACLLPGLDGQGLLNVLMKTREYGVTTSMDVSGDLDEGLKLKLIPSLAYTDIFIPSYYQACYITGEEKPERISEKLFAWGVKVAVIKMGKDGCFAASKDEEYHIPTYNDVKVVDTTGAGDAFVAGFLTAYSKRWPLFECGRFANAAGSMCVMKVGATDGMRPFDDIMDFITCMEVNGK